MIYEEVDLKSKCKDFVTHIYMKKTKGKTTQFSPFSPYARTTN